MSEELLKLHEYHVWANRKLLDYLKGMPDVLAAELPGAFPTMLREQG